MWCQFSLLWALGNDKSIEVSSVEWTMLEYLDLLASNNFKIKQSLLVSKKLLVRYDDIILGKLGMENLRQFSSSLWLNLWLRWFLFCLVGLQHVHLYLELGDFLWNKNMGICLLEWGFSYAQSGKGHPLFPSNY